MKIGHNSTAKITFADGKTLDIKDFVIDSMMSEMPFGGEPTTEIRLRTVGTPHTTNKIELYPTTPADPPKAERNRRGEKLLSRTTTHYTIHPPPWAIDLMLLAGLCLVWLAKSLWN